MTTSHAHSFPLVLLVACLVLESSAFHLPLRGGIHPTITSSIEEKPSFTSRRKVVPHFADLSHRSTSLVLGSSTPKSPSSAICTSNDELHDLLINLRESNQYFRLYGVDMLASCEYMPQELFECYSETCEIYPVDDEEIPQEIQIADAALSDFKLDSWARWDMPADDYYDTSDFPEGFTGYDGSEIWRFMHERIAFPSPEKDDWRYDFNKAISGIHSMISAQIILGIEEKIEMNEEFEENCKWRDPIEEYKRRLSSVGETPEALENFYYTYSLIVSALVSVKDYLIEDCGNSDELMTLLDSPLFVADKMSTGDGLTSISHISSNLAQKASNDSKALWEAKMRSRDMLRLMNCVQCNKCKLHGKISFLGLATVFRIILGQVEGVSEDGSINSDDFTNIRRVEFAALVTLLNKFTSAHKLCQRMEELV
eukprot:CAMPEP_0184866496 /NCGR_PEP_ID=MMETSP0580-20130426/22604_1 /TAXON_ID=1118495 /ORGANISM="Dactyliosolen fragilissimus" /LENGTH=425 /DNA_ID=CAMNT_0027366211 /DNA_START=145 /DNA_END=1422 /DNA_ORIENTATION=-